MEGVVNVANNNDAQKNDENQSKEGRPALLRGGEGRGRQTRLVPRGEGSLLSSFDLTQRRRKREGPPEPAA